ncbi:MAG: DNA-binding response regulator [Bacilli bacterium]|nr:DNA-binding response regulator [Bacilli bacterium]
MNTDKLIFVVDDDETIRRIIERYLENEGYQVELFATGELAWNRFESQQPDLFIMDIMMPGIDGYELCKRIRGVSELPIIMVSARDDEIDKILGLELGSDDYLSKPFSPRELVARVKTIFRRVGQAESAALKAADERKTETAIEIKDLRVFPDRRQVQHEEVEITLTTKEFDLFLFFVENSNKVFTREQLLNQVWGYDYIGDERAIDDLVKRLRKKLKSKGSIAEIRTVWGYGYKLES